MKRQCRNCMRRQPEHRCADVPRFGGGNYRRPGRWYRSTICIDCIVRLIGERSEPRYALESVGRWDFRYLVDARDMIRLIEGGD